jgi:acetyl esterase/lipase
VSTSATAAATVAPSQTVEPTPVPAPTAGAFPEELVAGLRTETDVPYTEPVPCGHGGDCAVPVDVLAPETGEALPTIVLLPGGPSVFNDRRYLETLAAELAGRGAVVFLATYRSGATGNTNDDGLSDVRCAIRFARSTTAEFGGDPDRLVLAGHSFGSSLALETGANAEAETPDCLSDEPGVPGAAVGLSGFTFEVHDPVEADLDFLLMSGSEDDAAATGEPGADRLREAGFDAEYVELEGIDHFEIVDPAVAPEVVDRILAAAESIAP